MATAGCGPTSVAMLAYAVDGKTTPWDVARYMQKHGYAIRNNGTAWSGIPAAMKAFGLSDVRNVAKMSDVFAYMAKGYCAEFLFSAGSKGGITWTSSGHYIAVTDYKVQNGKHYFYTRDSGGRNHTGWYCYETQMRGLIPQVWVGFAKAKAQPVLEPFVPKKLAVDGKFGINSRRLMQHWLQVETDGVVAGVTIRALQKKIGAKVDGRWAGGTTLALQKYLNKRGAKLREDRKFGPKTIKAFQTYLNITFGFDTPINNTTISVNKTTNTTTNNKPASSVARSESKTNADKIANMARACAYPSGTPKSKYSYPKGSATAEYKLALKKAFGERKGWGAQTKAGASCDVFVGAVIRATGYDTTFPRGLDGVLSHMKGNSKWTLTGIKDKSKMQAGDVIFQLYKGGGGHIFIYVGNGMIANAHYNGKTYGIIQKYSTTRPVSKCKIYNVYRSKG